MHRKNPSMLLCSTFYLRIVTSLIMTIGLVTSSNERALLPGNDETNYHNTPFYERAAFPYKAPPIRGDYRSERLVLNRKTHELRDAERHDTVTEATQKRSHDVTNLSAEEEIELREQEQLILPPSLTSRIEILRHFEAQILQASATELLEILYGNTSTAKTIRNHVAPERMYHDSPGGAWSRDIRLQTYGRRGHKRRHSSVAKGTPLNSMHEYHLEQSGIQSAMKENNHRTAVVVREPKSNGHRKRHTSGRGQRQENEIRLAQQHYNEQLNLNICKEPVAECLNFKNLSQAASEDYFPRCTRVHRCRSYYGCCEDTQRCAPKSIELLTSYVFVMKFIGSSMQSTKFVRPFTYENHTECECKEIGNIRKACLPCPHPFRREIVDATHCKCFCSDEDKTCLRIKRGKEALLENHKKCVERKECLIPSCRGDRLYDIESGTCLYPIATTRSTKFARTNANEAGSGYSDDVTT